MGTRKCCVKECTSEEGNEGITFHRFPQTNPENAEKWIKACKFESNFKPNKHSFVCSQHFRRENFTILQSGKIILKSLTIPSIFPWNKDTVVVTKATISIASDGESPDKKKKPEKSKDDTKTTEKVKDEATSSKTEATTPTKNEDPPKSQSSKKKGINAKKKEIPKPLLSPEKPKKSSKRLSAKLQQSEIKAKKAKIEEPPAESIDIKVTVKPEPSTPKKKNLIVNFIPGNTIEVQNFDGKWIPVKIIEVDTDEREVLVRSVDKNNKSKAGMNDEWISMDSPRLRPAQPTVTFEVGEKVLARWNDCRKFPATIKRVLENDSYDVLFDDGYPKIVRGIHIHKYTAKNAPKVLTTEPQAPVLINPLFLNPPSLIPDYIKEMKDLPKGPTEGEWCCVWVDDIPVGEESTFDGTHGKVPSIIIPDWRIKDGWQKHIYLRQNGKWDVLFISPTNRRLRFKNELKAYLAEIGEIYDPEVWDFSLHKKRSKALDLCIQSDKLKHQVHSFEVKNQKAADGSTVFNNPFANLGALPYVQPNLVTAAPIQTEVSVGSLKVKVINNNYHCPGESCDKIFRKENHLQIHIKHYHEKLAKLMGECPNMEDLAYLRTTVDEAEITLVKSNRKSNLLKEKSKSSRNEFNDSFKEPYVKLENISSESKLIVRSPILEEALKAPLITSQMTPIKTEPDIDNKLDLTPNSLRTFDPESLIPPHAVTRPHLKAQRRKMRIRFNPKPKKHGQKKHKFDYQNGETVSAVEGVIPYNEGPYFKNQQQSSYIDENGEVIKIVRMKKEEIINCICGYGEEDGLMIQCELCLCWQHGICHGYEKSTQVPDKHVCLICKNPYRQRTSKRFFHDQDWLYDGKLSIANYHVPNPKQTARFDTLKSCHTLIGNLIEMRKFMNSLDVKMNIAENIEHPKMYLWAKKWEQSPPRESADKKDDIKRDIKFEADVKIQSVAPEPEAAIEPRKCQQNLLDHIQNQQNTVKLRLDNIEKEIAFLEDEGSSKILNGKKPVDDSTLKQTLYMLINDLKQMNDFSDIHRNPLEES